MDQLLDLHKDRGVKGAEPLQLRTERHQKGNAHLHKCVATTDFLTFHRSNMMKRSKRLSWCPDVI